MNLSIDTKLQTFQAYINNGDIECLCSPKNNEISSFNYIGFDQHNRRLYNCTDCNTVYYIPKTK
jgi:hypothetical protein